MVIKIGMIGFSEGNGHPFSFSSIINGYLEPELYQTEWKVICDYVTKRDPSEFGFEGVYVTDAWTQNLNLTKQLCKACLIPNAHLEFIDMIGKVDAVIVARDDYESHFEIAMPFLEAGTYVFLDKPLSLNIEELNKLNPYLEKGQLMSCSGMRYAIELDDVRKNLTQLGELKYIQGIAPNTWEKYGVHLLEAIFSVISAKPKTITAIDANGASMLITMENGLTINITNLGRSNIPFKIDFCGSQGFASIQIKDNFSMFRRMLWHFIQMIKTNKNSIPAETTMTIMGILIAGQNSKKENRKIYYDEIWELF